LVNPVVQDVAVVTYFVDHVRRLPIPMRFDEEVHR